MIHNMKLRPGPFGGIAAGEKTIELRLLDEKRRGIAVGDEIVFVSTEDPTAVLRRRVRRLHVFANFAELYRELPLDKCGYRPHELASASPKDMESYYTPEEQARFGVVGIELELPD